jgi:hypothetical protein
MGDDRFRLDDDAVESVLGELFPDAAPWDVESFMGALQRFGKEAAPIAQRALPGAVQGALTGASVGGPYGALAGAALGATSGALSRPTGPTALTPSAPAAPVSPAAPVAPVAPVPPAAPVQPSAVPAQPPVAAATAGSLPMSPQAAAGAVLEVMTHPATLEAFMTMLMQAAGRSTVKVGGQQVPPAAFANAIAEFASLAAASDTPTESASDYLYGESGWPRGDLANPAERAAILLSDLREATSDREAPISAYERVAYGWRTDG